MVKVTEVMGAIGDPGGVNRRDEVVAAVLVGDLGTMEAVDVADGTSCVVRAVPELLRTSVASCSFSPWEVALVAEPSGCKLPVAGITGRAWPEM